MNLFERIKLLWVGFFSSILGNTERNNQHWLNEGIIQKQRQQLEKVRNTTTQLIYQRKKTDTQLNSLRSQKVEIEGDLEQAALSNKDELAIHIMEKLDQISEEIGFLEDHRLRLETDLKEAQELESQLVRQAETTKYQLQALSTRHQSLKLRKQIKSDLQGSTVSLPQVSKISEQINDQILKLEAETEALTDDRSPLDKEIRELRQLRKSASYQTRLTQLKSSLNGSLLTGTHLKKVNA